MKPTRFNNILFSQSMFLKLVASFLIIILILSSFYLVSYNFFIKGIESEIINNSNERLDNFVNKIDKSLLQIKNIMLRLSREDFFNSVAAGSIISPNIKKLFIDTYASYGPLLDFNTAYINNIFILPANLQDNLMTSEASYNTNTFFELFYKNPTYTKDFWVDEMSKGFSFKFYPLGRFTDISHYMNPTDVSSNLMPLAFKASNNNNYIIVAYINIEALFRTADEAFTSNFYIADENNEILYSSHEQPSFKDDLDFRNINKYAKTKHGYAFKRVSAENNLSYLRLLPNDNLKAQLSKTNAMFQLITILSLITSILISIFIVKRFNNPVKQIINILNSSKSSDSATPKAFNFKYLRDNIQNLIIENTELSYQAIIRNIYPDTKSPLDIKQKYIVVYFKIHLKKSTDKTIAAVDNKTSIYYTELIQLYVSSYFDDSVTFQADNDQIVSVINIFQDETVVDNSLQSISNKLKNEEDYAFFTIVISKVYCDISELSKAYARALEISDFRKPIAETQILTDNISNICNNFYFPLEKAEVFINKLSSGQKKECLDIAENILDYNSRKGVNCFYIRLLCNEIVNCCTKALIKSYYDVPKEIDINNTYFQIKLSSTIPELKDILSGYITIVADFIANNHKQSDYIIDYITNYIEDNYEDEVYVDLLAEKLNLTSNYISSYFKDRVGVNLSDYINNFRIRKSVEALGSSSVKVKDIAARVGFSNVNSFIRTFKKYIGMTPVDYRRQMSGLHPGPLNES